MAKYKLECGKGQTLKKDGTRYYNGDTVELSDDEAAQLSKTVKMRKLSPGRPAVPKAAPKPEPSSPRPERKEPSRPK
jgi:hypothetical protein